MKSGISRVGSWMVRWHGATGEQEKTRIPREVKQQNKEWLWSKISTEQSGLYSPFLVLYKVMCFFLISLSSTNLDFSPPHKDADNKLFQQEKNSSFFHKLSIMSFRNTFFLSFSFFFFYISPQTCSKPVRGNPLSPPVHMLCRLLLHSDVPVRARTHTHIHTKKKHAVDCR